MTTRQFKNLFSLAFLLTTIGSFSYAKSNSPSGDLQIDGYGGATFDFSAEHSKSLFEAMFKGHEQNKLAYRVEEVSQAQFDAITLCGKKITKTWDQEQTLTDYVCKNKNGKEFGDVAQKMYEKAMAEKHEKSQILTLHGKNIGCTRQIALKTDENPTETTEYICGVFIDFTSGLTESNAPWVLF